MKRVALALSLLLFAACDPQISALAIDAGVWDASGLECAENPCLNEGVCHVGDEGFRCACPPGFEGDLCEVDVDDCDPNPCKNDGLCSDRVASYSCACAPGFSGVDCSTNIDECADEPCENSGTCTDMVNGYQCDCAAGYSGSRCEVNVDDCLTMPCENGGECQDEINGFTCQCIEGNVGPTCSNQVEVCSDGLCQHGGTCENSDEGYKCTCAAGYNGVNCENDIDDCTPLPCQNGANCVDEVNGYSCECPDGYTGVNCEGEINPCNPDPCQNGGECTSAGDYPVCSCQEGYNGPRCENNIDDCAINPCANGGTCTDDVAGFTCECTTGFSGPTCNNEPPECPETNPCEHGQCIDGINGYKCDCDTGFIGAICDVNVDDCEPNPCDHGTCADGDNTYTCTCDAGYEGPACQTDIDDCLEEPCKNGGTCQDQLNGYECMCAPGWGGDTCEAEIDECEPNPCENGGTCTDAVNSYSCDCPGGFSGDRCEQDHCDLQGACGNGMCDGQGGCICQDGWEGAECREDIDECERNMPCSNGGECTDLDGSFNCDCATGYTGVFCDECAEGYQDNDDDDVCCATGYAGSDCLQCDEGYESVSGNCQRTCASSPKDCGDNGMCNDAGGDTICICDAMYFGDVCDSFMGMCSDGICGANGACEMTSENTFKCACEPGYVGRNCETLDECALAIANQETPCQNGGTCVDGDNTYTCTCTNGWTGADCSEIEACQVAVANGQTPCSGNGTCIDAAGADYTCDCDDGWLEDDCSEEDNCVDHQCLNGGACIDGEGTYTCECAEDYEGNRCQTREDDCASNPCMHGGVCSNVGTGYECDCARTGYGGTNCEDDFDECTQANICGNGTCANVAGGAGYTCKCPDGTMDVVGNGTNCPEVTSVYAGAANSCAISEAGSLHCWGDNAYGQLGQGHSVNPDSAEIRRPYRIGTGTDWSKVSIGGQHICGLRGGHLFCWGRNEHLQISAPMSTARNEPLGIRPDLTWTDVSVGDSHTCALAGTALYCWGNTTDGQAGESTRTVTLEMESIAVVDAPKQISGTWSKVSAGAFHTCAINTEDELHCWGRNTSGQTAGTPPIALPVGSDGPWSAVEAGPQHTCAVAGTRTYCWGEGTKGALGNSASNDNATPQQVSFGQALGLLATGEDLSCGTTASTAFQLYCWGTNDYGLLLMGGDVNEPALIATSGTPTWDSYAVGARHMCAVDDGLVRCWGSNADGAVGSVAPSGTLIATPTLVATPTITHSGSDYCSPNPCRNGGVCESTESGFTCDCEGTGYGGTTCTTTVDECATPGICGEGTCRDLLDDEGYSCTCPDGLIDVDQTGTTCAEVAQIAAGFNHTCVITTAGTLHCWGSNRYGQFGLGATGTTAYYPDESSQTIRTPLRVRTVTGVIGAVAGWNRIAVGSNHTCATRTSSGGEQLYCWGDNASGQVGGSTAPENYAAAPRLLDSTQTWSALSAGDSHTCGIASGELYCWGSNNRGQIGDGTSGGTLTRPFSLLTAVPVPDGSASWETVAAGTGHTCATTDTQTSYCWGKNTGVPASTITGQLGNGAPGGTALVTSPVSVTLPEPQGFTALVADSTHSCGLVANSAYCWGQGTIGAVGDAANTNRTVPTPVSGGLSFTRLSLGSNLSCGLVAIPSTTPQAYDAYCWGSNTKNVLLTGGGNVNVPTAVNTMRDWRVFEVGSTHICAVDNADGKLYCWGDNTLENGDVGGKLGFLPTSQLGNAGIGAVKAAPATYPAP